MKKLQIIILLFILSFQFAFSQTKKIEGDTTYIFKWNKGHQKTLGLKEFEKSTDEFNFRFWNHGQVIEITKNSSAINGTLTNYIYHTEKKNKRDTLSNKIILSSEQAKNIYNIIQNSEILNLQSDNKIENWKRGVDGITYIIEHSDKNNYWFKNYWTPSIQDSIPEALIVINLVRNISDTLKLQETYTRFENDLPRKGCYTSGGLVQFCYISNSLELGYSGATKLPLGFYISNSTTYLGKTEINSGVVLKYNYNNNGFYNFDFQVSKWNIFYKKSKFSDFITYNYQNRKLDIDDVNNKFQNHQVKYGLNLKDNVSVGIGLDYLIRESEKVGGHLYASKWFSKPKISASLASSIFTNQLNYEIEMFKSFVLNYRFPIRRISFGCGYEEFMNYKDLYFKVLLLIY